MATQESGGVVGFRIDDGVTNCGRDVYSVLTRCCTHFLSASTSGKLEWKVRCTHSTAVKKDPTDTRLNNRSTDVRAAS